MLTSVSYPEFASLKDYLFDNDSNKKFVFEVSIVWLNAKLLSFNFDRSNEQISVSHNREDDFDLIFARNIKKITKDEYFYIFAYLLYVPTFFTGPLNHYSPFVRVRECTFFENSSFLEIIHKLLVYLFD